MKKKYYTDINRWQVEYTEASKRKRHRFKSEDEADDFIYQLKHGSLYAPVKFDKIINDYTHYLTTQGASTTSVRQLNSGAKLYKERFGQQIATREMAIRLQADIGTSSYASLRAAFTHAVRLGVLPKNPLQTGVKQGRLETQRSKKKVEVLTETQIKLLLQHANLEQEKYIKTALITGARAHEVINILTNDVNLDYVLIKEGKGKKDYDLRSRRIPITSRDYMELRSNSLIFLCNHKSKQWNYQNLHASMKKLFKQAGIKVSQPTHIFRHTAITRWVSQGIPLNVAQSRAGHKNVNTTARYCHAVSA